jgi:hypothetical protein
LDHEPWTKPEFFTPHLPRPIIINAIPFPGKPYS